MSEPVTLELGLIEVKAVPATAYAGFGGRVHATTAHAIVDLGKNELAKLWLNTTGAKYSNFDALFSLIEHSPDVAEAAVKLARFKAGAGI